MPRAYAAWTGSVARLIFLSFGFGIGAFQFIIQFGGLPRTYSDDALASWIIAPAGFFFGMVFTIFVHEFAHAITARAVGGHLHGITIGSGPLLAQFPALGTICRVHASLISGAVRYGLTSPQNLRKKFACITAAAPAATLALCALNVGLLSWLMKGGADLSLLAKPIAFATGWTVSAFFIFPELSCRSALTTMAED